MDIKVYPSELNGMVPVCRSKWGLVRSVFCCALADEDTILGIGEAGDDVAEALDAVRALGGAVQPVSEREIRITPIWKNKVKHPIINARRSGEFIRFVLPIAAAIFDGFTVHHDGVTLPHSPLKMLMQSHGCTVTEDSMKVTVKGKLRAGEYALAEGMGERFVYGLLMALPLLDGESTVSFKLQPESYAIRCLDTVYRFGISAVKEGDSYRFKGGQKYRKPFDLEKLAIEGDWTRGGLWLTAGAMSGNVCVGGLDKSSSHPDKEILNVLHAMGAEISIDKHTGSVFTEKSALSGATVDASLCPNLVPVLAAAMCFGNGVGRIKNVHFLRYRLWQSQRIGALVEGLTQLGAKIIDYGDEIAIEGVKRMKGGTVDSHGDHRVVMALAIAACRCQDGVVIKNADAVRESYPRFFDDLRALGGRAEVVKP